MGAGYRGPVLHVHARIASTVRGLAMPCLVRLSIPFAQPLVRLCVPCTGGWLAIPRLRESDALKRLGPQEQQRGVWQLALLCLWRGGLLLPVKHLKKGQNVCPCDL